MFALKLSQQNKMQSIRNTFTQANRNSSSLLRQTLIQSMLFMCSDYICENKITLFMSFYETQQNIDKRNKD